MKACYRLVLAVTFMLVAIFSSGCTTVNYVKEIDKSMKNLDKLNDRLQVARMNTDSAAFAELLESMKKETDHLNELDPGLMKWKGSKDVKEKTDAIASLVEEIKQKAGSDDQELDELMKKLSDEIAEVVE